MKDYEYAYLRISDLGAKIAENNQELAVDLYPAQLAARTWLAAHLDKVAEAACAVQKVDEGDCSAGQELESIAACGWAPPADDFANTIQGLNRGIGILQTEMEKHLAFATQDAKDPARERDSASLVAAQVCCNAAKDLEQAVKTLLALTPSPANKEKP